VDLKNPVSINTTGVATIWTVERCLVRRLTLTMGIGGSHFHIYALNMDKGVLLRRDTQSEMSLHKDEITALVGQSAVQDTQTY
jgi:hypothetical protein